MVAYRLEGSAEPAGAGHVQAVCRHDRPAAVEGEAAAPHALIGTEVPFALLHAVAERPEDATPDWGLAHLQAAEFLYETSLFPEIAYTFKHALTQEVAYG